MYFTLRRNEELPMGKKKGSQLFDASSTRFCESCNKQVKIGFGGEGNWKIHTGSFAHRLSQPIKKNSKIISFFSKAAPADRTSIASVVEPPVAQLLSQINHVSPTSGPPEPNLRGCPVQSSSLKLRVEASDLPQIISEATTFDTLGIFAAHSTRLRNKNAAEKKIESSRSDEENGEVEGSGTNHVAKLHPGNRETIDNRAVTLSAGRKRRVGDFEHAKELVCADEGCEALVSEEELLPCSSPGCYLVYNLTCHGLIYRPSEDRSCEDECRKNMGGGRKKRRHN